MISAARSLVIDPRFQGPPDSGNGGYVAGMLAREIGTSAEVRLRAPAPTTRALRIEREREAALLYDGTQLIAEARPGDPGIEPPAAPSFERAQEAARNYLGFVRHPLPNCFVCGPARADGDGLRVFAGPLADSDLVAAPWIPHSELVDPATGGIAQEFLWAALDCPGVFAFGPSNERFMLLGTLAARMVGTVQAGERCVIVGWPLGRSGRKHFSGTALFGDGGELRGIAHATWIEIEPPSS